MKKLLTLALVLGSASALAACAGTGSSELDETRTQAPYAEERTAGGYQPYEAPASEVRSAEPVFQRATNK